MFILFDKEIFLKFSSLCIGKTQNFLNFSFDAMQENIPAENATYGFQISKGEGILAGCIWQTALLYPHDNDRCRPWREICQKGESMACDIPPFFWIKIHEILATRAKQPLSAFNMAPWIAKERRWFSLRRTMVKRAIFTSTAQASLYSHSIRGLAHCTLQNLKTPPPLYAGLTTYVTSHLWSAVRKGKTLPSPSLQRTMCNN